MRYFMISDVHGCFDKMIAALKEANFDPEKDTLVSLGDPFDRGPQSLEVLKYLLNTPHHIFIWGNHDARLYKLFRTLSIDNISAYQNDYYNDVWNGLEETIKSFTSYKCYNMHLYDAIILFRERASHKEVREQFLSYVSQCHFAVEFPGLIATHAWVPTIEHVHPKPLPLKPNNTVSTFELDTSWRNAGKTDWYWATWSNTEDMYDNKCFPDKPLIVGHWHAWRFATHCGEKRFDVPSIASFKYSTPFNPDTYITADKKLTLIDGCTNLEYGKVNVFIYETEDKPTFIDGVIN